MYDKDKRERKRKRRIEREGIGIKYSNLDVTKRERKEGVLFFYFDSFDVRKIQKNRVIDCYQFEYSQASRREDHLTESVPVCESDLR